MCPSPSDGDDPIGPLMSMPIPTRLCNGTARWGTSIQAPVSQGSAFLMISSSSSHVVTRAVSQPSQPGDELLPWNWKARPATLAPRAARSGLSGFAVCHYGPRYEAGADTCFIKFGAVRLGAHAERDFARLLDACEAFSVRVGMPTLLAGANMARYEAYRHLAARGFRTALQGVAMHRPNEPGYSRPGVYIIDDWR
jgi:hypothetical protein